MQVDSSQVNSIQTNPSHSIQFRQFSKMHFKSRQGKSRQCNSMQFFLIPLNFNSNSVQFNSSHFQFDSIRWKSMQSLSLQPDPTQTNQPNPNKTNDLTSIQCWLKWNQCKASHEHSIHVQYYSTRVLPESIQL